MQEGKTESLRDGIFEIVKEIVSVERDGGREGARERVGVHCEQQIVGAHVVEVAQVPGALLFHGSHSLSVKTAQPCRQLCSGGCGGERRGEERRGEERRGERREERGPLFSIFAPHLHQRPCFFLSLGIAAHSFLPNLWVLPCLFYSSAEVPQKKQKNLVAFDSVYMSDG